VEILKDDVAFSGATKAGCVDADFGGKGERRDGYSRRRLRLAKTREDRTFERKAPKTETMLER
jgi:hypothetical protein